MQTSLSDDLIVAAIACFCLCALVQSRYLPQRAALWIAGVKAAIPFFFFAFLNDGQWILRDDLTYLRNANILMDRGWQPVDVLLAPAGLKLMAALSSGWHIAYTWWNLVAISLLGNHYFSAVFLNVAATSLAGWWLFDGLKHAGMKKEFASGATCLFLLHWELLSWSSIVNVKDVLVLSLSVLAFSGIARLASKTSSYKEKWAGLLGLVAACFLFLWLRFYAPALILVAAGIWLVSDKQSPGKAIGFGVLLLAAGFIYWRSSSLPAPVGFGEWASGAVRFLLTPQPWSIEGKYQFLGPASVLHLGMIVPMIVGSISLAKSSSLFRFALIYLLLVTLFYGAVEELQGPRHRLQLVWIFAWAQWEFIAMVIGLWRSKQGQGAVAHA